MALEHGFVESARIPSSAPCRSFSPLSRCLIVSPAEGRRPFPCCRARDKRYSTCRGWATNGVRIAECLPLRASAGSRGLCSVRFGVSGHPFRDHVDSLRWLLPGRSSYMQRDGGAMIRSLTTPGISRQQGLDTLSDGGGPFLRPVRMAACRRVTNRIWLLSSSMTGLTTVKPWNYLIW